MRSAILVILGILVGLVVGYYVGIKERPRTVLVDGGTGSSSSTSSPLGGTSDLVERSGGSGFDLPVDFSPTAGV